MFNSVACVTRLFHPDAWGGVYDIAVSAYRESVLKLGGDILSQFTIVDEELQTFCDEVLIR
jgi:hypothetical protein